MKKILVLLFALISIIPGSVLAQENSPAIDLPLISTPESVSNEMPGSLKPTLEYNLGKVTEILRDEDKSLAGNTHKVQSLKVTIVLGPDKGKEVVLSDHIITQDSQKFKVGEHAVVMKQGFDDEMTYYASDKYRLPSLAIIFGIFFALAIIFARLKGLTAIFGLAVSLLILIQFIIPRILAGGNPFLVSLAGAVAIAVLSLYLAHGFTKRTSLSLLSTLITLAIATGLSLLFVSMAKLTGVGSDEAFYLQIGPIDQLNLKGLLLGGIMIGVLGVLDDVTTSQTAAVDEIHSADPKLPFKELYKRALSIGQEHIASLVNTLVLAYAGASFPLLLLFTINQEMPLWVKLNGEMIAEELIRTLVGSSALILAVPIATVIAAYYFEGRAPSREPVHGHHH